MDKESELARAKWMLAALVVFVLSLFLTYQEFNYLIRSHRTEAKITRINEVTTKRLLGEDKNLEVWYEYADEEGKKRENSAHYSTTWVAPASGTLTVDYLPGGDGSRTGGVAWWWFCLVGIATAVLAFVAYRFWRNIQEQLEDKPRRMKR